MIRRAMAVLIVACAAAIVAQALLLWDATRIDGYAYTRYHDPVRAEREAQAGDSLADLFAETGLEDNTGAIEAPPNRFMLGLLPGGGGRHAVSLLTLAGPAAIAGACAFALLVLGTGRVRPASDDAAKPRGETLQV